jgi:hypothetical protein
VATSRVHFDGKVFIPVDPVDAPTGRLLEIDIREAARPHADLPLGSPALLRSLMREPPHLSPEDIGELERD